MPPPPTDTASVAPVDAAEASRRFMGIEANVMAACSLCAGSASMDASGIVCALPKDERVDCILPRLLKELRPPSARADRDGELPARARRRIQLTLIATPVWIAQHARNIAPLPPASDDDATTTTPGTDDNDDAPPPAAAAASPSSPPPGPPAEAEGA